jgi:hypothetical protein
MIAFPLIALVMTAVLCDSFLLQGWTSRMRTIMAEETIYWNLGECGGLAFTLL